jgi:predicted nucleic acid-binding protein
MTFASLERALPAGERLRVDTTTFVSYLDGGEAVTPLAAHVLDELVEPGRNPAVLSMVTISELLVRPLRVGVSDRYENLLDLLTHFPNLRPRSVDLPVAQEAASLRAAFRLSMADSLIVATGIVAQVHHLVTNDVDWQRRLQPISSRIRVCLLGQHL